MPTVKKTVKNAAKKVEEINGKNPVVKISRNMFRASLGAIAAGREEVESVMERLVEKGEVAEKDSRKRLEGMFERRRKDVTKAEDKVEGMLDQRIESVLNAMNIPAKGDIESLSRKISTLSRKVSELDKKLSEETKIAA